MPKRYKVGQSGSFFERKKEYRVFEDKNGRPINFRKDGRFGKDEKTTRLDNKSIFAYQFELEVGDYKFGSGKFELSKSGVNFSAEIAGPKTTFDVNKSITELSKDAGFDGKIVDSLREAVLQSRFNFDLNSIKVKNIELSSPAASIGANLATDKVGAKASAQVAAVGVTLETPLGEISAKFKAGSSLGSEVGFTETKSGKPGLKRTQKLAIGLWEFSLSPDFQNNILPSLFDMNAYAGTPENYKFTASQEESTRKLFNKQDLSCRFDFDSLSQIKSSPSIADVDQNIDIDWNEPLSSGANRSPQGILSEQLSEPVTLDNLTEIPATADQSEAKAILEKNLALFDLEKNAVSKDVNQLSTDQLKEINRQLIELTKTQNETMALLQAEQEKLKTAEDEKAQNEALARLAQGAEGLRAFGRQTRCRVFEVIGTAIQFTLKIIEVFKAIDNIAADSKALGNIFAPLAAMAPLGAIGAVLGAFTMFLSLFSSESGPDRIAIIIGKLDDLLKGQQEILGLLDTVRDEQAIMLRTIRQDLEALKFELKESISSTRIELSDALEKIESSISFLSEFNRIAARNQFLQQFKNTCSQASLLSLNQGRNAENITSGLETMLFNDSSNEILNGYAEWQANLPKTSQLQILTKLTSSKIPEEIKDHYSNFLLGYIFQIPMVNPLIWQQAAQQYILHTQRFFALYMEDTDGTLLKTISQGNYFLDIFDKHLSGDKLQEHIDAYYQALINVKDNQQVLINQFNNCRRQHLNLNYSNSTLGSERIDELDFFAAPQTFIDKFQEFDNNHQKYKYTISHLNPKQVGKTAQSLQVLFNAYPNKENDAIADRSFDISLSELVNKLRQKPEQNSSSRYVFNMLLAAEYLGLTGFTIEADVMTYPDIPVRKSPGEAHVKEIIRTNEEGVPGHYYLREENTPWTINVAINYGDLSCEIILSPNLPTINDIDTLLTTTNSGYIFSSHNRERRIYFLSKHPREFSQVFNFRDTFFDTTKQQISDTGATRRAIAAEEANYLATLHHREGALNISVSDTYLSFDNKISGVQEQLGSYIEPADEAASFHKKIRLAIPRYIQKLWHDKKFTLRMAANEEALLKKQIEDKFIQERELFLQSLINKRSDNSTIQHYLEKYHESLTDLDIASLRLQYLINLAGKEYNGQLLDSEIVLKEISDNYKSLMLSDLSPSLTKVCALKKDERIKLDDFKDKKELSKYHPISLLHNTLAQLRTHKCWRNWMRKSYPWMKFSDLHQLWAMRIYSRIERLHENLYAQYKDLKTDVNNFTFASDRLRYADSTPITNQKTFLKVYYAINDWAIGQAKNPLVTGYVQKPASREQLLTNYDNDKLKYGWSDNIAFLLQYAKQDIELDIDASELVNFTFWFDGAIQICKLLDHKIGPYPNIQTLAVNAGIDLEKQINALSRIEKSGRILQDVVIAVAFSEKLFDDLFEKYISLLNSIQLLTQQSSYDTDFSIIKAMLPDDFVEGRIHAGSFTKIKIQLNLYELLISNFVSLGFSNQFTQLLDKTIFNGDDIENELRAIMAVPSSKNVSENRPLQKLLQKLLKRAKYSKEVILENICHNRSLNYFAKRLEHYHDRKELEKVDTLCITQDFMLKGSEVQNSIPFSEEHLDLIAQYLEKNPQICGISLIGIPLSSGIIDQIVKLIVFYPRIKKLTLAAAQLEPDNFNQLRPLLPNIEFLDLRGNLLGDDRLDTTNTRHINLIPLIKEAAKSNLKYLGLANTNLSEPDLTAIHANLLMNPPQQNLSLDICGNSNSNISEIKNTEIIIKQEDSVAKFKPSEIKDIPQPFTLTPEFEVAGQPILNQVLNLLANTRQLLINTKQLGEKLNQEATQPAAAPHTPTESNRKMTL